jgi:hypothetical protein
VRNEEVLHIVKMERNILRTRNRRKTNWIGHTFYRKSFLKHVTDGKIQRSRNRRKILKQIVNNLKEKRNAGI